MVKVVIEIHGIPLRSSSGLAQGMQGEILKSFASTEYKNKITVSCVEDSVCDQEGGKIEPFYFIRVYPTPEVNTRFVLTRLANMYDLPIQLMEKGVFFFSLQSGADGQGVNSGVAEKPSGKLKECECTLHGLPNRNGICQNCGGMIPGIIPQDPRRPLDGAKEKHFGTCEVCGCILVMTANGGICLNCGWRTASPNTTAKNKPGICPDCGAATIVSGNGVICQVCNMNKACS